MTNPPPYSIQYELWRGKSHSNTTTKEKTCNQFSWLQIYTYILYVCTFFSACCTHDTTRHDTTHCICLCFPAHFVAFHMEAFTKCISKHESQLSCLIKSTLVFFCVSACIWALPLSVLLYVDFFFITPLVLVEYFFCEIQFW